MFKSGDQLQRLIFYKQEQWEDLEQMHLEGFKKFLADTNLQIPDCLPDNEILRTLHGTGWNYKQTHADSWVIQKWREEHLPIRLTSSDEKILVSIIPCLWR